MVIEFIRKVVDCRDPTRCGSEIGEDCPAAGVGEECQEVVVAIPLTTSRMIHDHLDTLRDHFVDVYVPIQKQEWHK